RAWCEVRSLERGLEVFAEAESLSFEGCSPAAVIADATKVAAAYVNSDIDCIPVVQAGFDPVPQLSCLTGIDGVGALSNRDSGCIIECVRHGRGEAAADQRSYHTDAKHQGPSVCSHVHRLPSAPTHYTVGNYALSRGVRETRGHAEIARSRVV